MPARAHVRALIWRLAAATPRARARKRLPHQLQPDAIRIDYFRALRPICRAASSAFAPERAAILALLEQERADERRDGERFDAGRKSEARKRVEAAAHRFADSFQPDELREVAKKFGKRTLDFQRGELDKQVRAAIGVPFKAIEKPIRDLIPAFTSSNVELVKTVPDRYFERLRRDVSDAFESGMHPETLAERFVEIDGMSENDAMRIARDQIGKLCAEVNQARQESMGVTGYTWRGALDNRERDEHVEREGEHFEWDDPPEDGHPGEPVCCRCYAEPDFSPLLDGGDDNS